MLNENFTTIQILLIIIIPSLITGIPAGISAFGAWKNKRKKLSEALSDEGNAAEKLSLAWGKFAEDLQRQIDKMDVRQTESEVKQEKLNIRLNRQRKRINYLEDGIQILIKQLKILGVEPNFILKDEEEKGE
jgi:hypothetical protein